MQGRPLSVSLLRIGVEKQMVTVPQQLSHAPGASVPGALGQVQTTPPGLAQAFPKA